MAVAFVEARARYLRMIALLGLLAQEGDQVVSVLALLQTTEGHLGSGNVLLGVFEVLELREVSFMCADVLVRGKTRLTRVSSAQVMPFFLLDSE